MRALVTGCWPTQAICIAVGLSLLVGCADRPQERATGAGHHLAGEQPLPALGDYLPPLDAGRIELAPPKGWYIPSASSEYVVRVQQSNQDKYPSVTVTAEDYDDASISTVSAENVEKFAAQVAAAAGKEPAAVRPMEIGNRMGVAYAKRGKVTKPVTRILDLMYWETVVAGRKYRFELRSEDGALERGRPYLLAVVGGTRFLEAPSETSKPAAQQKPLEHPKAEKLPAEKLPTEAKSPVKPPAEPKAGPEGRQPARPSPQEKPAGQAKQEITAKEAPKEKATDKTKQQTSEKPKAKAAEDLDLDLDKLDELLKK